MHCLVSLTPLAGRVFSNNTTGRSYASFSIRAIVFTVSSVSVSTFHPRILEACGINTRCPSYGLHLPWGTLGIPETKVKQSWDARDLHQPLTHEKFNILETAIEFTKIIGTVLDKVVQGGATKGLTILLRPVTRVVSVPNHGSPALRLPA